MQRNRTIASGFFSYYRLVFEPKVTRYQRLNARFPKVIQHFVDGSEQIVLAFRHADCVLLLRRRVGVVVKRQARVVGISAAKELCRQFIYDYDVNSRADEGKRHGRGSVRNQIVSVLSAKGPSAIS